MAGGTAGATPSKPGVQHRGARCWGPSGGQGVCRARHHPAPSPRAAGPHVPSVPSLRDLLEPRSHCFPIALDPSVPAHSSCGGPRCSSPASCPREHIGPQSPGVTPSLQAGLCLKAPPPIPSTCQDLAAAAAFFFLFYKEEVGFLLLGPPDERCQPNPGLSRAERSHCQEADSPPAIVPRRL